ncbi:MAG: adenylosuccinate synthetase, partial [Polyangiales bacterium]
GRPRRCGWLDLPALRYAARVNGLTALAVTKLDILSGYDQIPVCTKYRVDGVETAELPVDDLDRAEPVYEQFAGWKDALSGARTLDALPSAARAYIAMIEERVEVKIAMVSVGAERTETVVLGDAFSYVR